MATINRHSKLILVGIMLLSLSAVLCSSLMAAELDRAREAAQAGLKQWLEAIPPQSLSLFGFKNKEELASATLGRPYRVHTIDPDDIAHYQGHDINALITPTKVWFFPVEVNGEARAILTVDLVDGEHQAVSIGNAGLSRQIQDARQRYSPADRGQLKFVRVYQAQADFLVLEGANVGPQNLVPMESAVKALPQMGMVAGQAAQPVDVLPHLKQVVQSALKDKQPKGDSK